MNKMQTEPMAPAETVEEPKRKRARVDGGRNWTRTIIMLLVPALLIVGGIYYYLSSGGSVSTDDAQIKQDIVSVSPQVNGQVVAVYVRNGAHVKKGDL
ncbi:MAG TPA: biotin/lipoyl-binding protein, partial [Sphingomicrobium sp.]